MQARSLASIGASAVAVTGGSVALAQSAPTVTAVGQADTARPVATPAPDAQGGLADVVVTAQRREQSLQDVAVPATAVSGDQVAALNATQADAITLLAPAVSISQAAGAFTLFYLRGVGSYVGGDGIVGITDPRAGAFFATRPVAERPIRCSRRSKTMAIGA